MRTPKHKSDQRNPQEKAGERQALADALHAGKAQKARGDGSNNQREGGRSDPAPSESFADGGRKPEARDKESGITTEASHRMNQGGGGFEVGHVGRERTGKRHEESSSNYRK